MRRFSLFMFITMLTFTATAWAAPAKAREAWASGQLERVDATARSVVLKQGTHEMTFVLASTAQLMEGKRAVTLDDLSHALGHGVKVRYSVKGSEKIADRLEVAMPATTPTAPATKTPAAPMPKKPKP